jgi:Holliday junction DNA helicase RuvA
MIASLEGVVGAIAADSVVIEVGGIGYRVYVAPAVISTTAAGGRLKLHTYHLVREDQQALFGFRNSEELGFFNLLLTVTGVGPKVAMAIVGSRPTADLQLAILQQDQAVLVSIPGIGKKLAERIIFELKEKVSAAGIAAGTSAAVSTRGRGSASGPWLLAGRGPRGVAACPPGPGGRSRPRGARQGGAAHPAPRLTVTSAGPRRRVRGRGSRPRRIRRPPATTISNICTIPRANLLYSD